MGMSLSERGKRGGQATLTRYGSEHYVEMGRRGALHNRALRDTIYFQSLGTLGGRATLAKYGRDYFAAIGKLGGKAIHERER